MMRGRVATVSAFLTVGFSHAQYPSVSYARYPSGSGT